MDAWQCRSSLLLQFPQINSLSSTDDCHTAPPRVEGVTSTKLQSSIGSTGSYPGYNMSVESLKRWQIHNMCLKVDVISWKTRSNFIKHTSVKERILDRRFHSRTNFWLRDLITKRYNYREKSIFFNILHIMQWWSYNNKCYKEVISFLIVLKFALDEMRCHSSVSLPNLCRRFNFFFLFHSCDLLCHSVDLIRMRIRGSREKDGASLGNHLTDKDWVDVLYWKTTGWFTNSKTQIDVNTHWTHTFRRDAHTVSDTLCFRLFSISAADTQAQEK